MLPHEVQLNWGRFDFNTIVANNNNNNDDGNNNNNNGNFLFTHFLSVWFQSLSLMTLFFCFF